MRFLPLLILLLPCLVGAHDCGDCSEVHKQVERERLRDAQLHGCRSCKKLVTNRDGCPPFGYECRTDFGMTISTITSTNQCIETRCAGPIAKLAVGGKIITKVRCNNTQWTNGADPATPAVCAMPCNAQACTSSHPDAPLDFSELIVTPADENTESSCAVGGCQYGKVAIDAADGSLLYPLDYLEGVPEVECTGDGEWVYGATERYKYVMCNRLGCGPLKCPALIFGEGMMSGAVVPLTIKGMGSECAVATCVAGYYSMTASGEVGVALVNPSLVCGTDGLWHNGGNSYPYVMCAPPPCPNNCDESPVESLLFPTTSQAIRTGCSYSCPDDKAMFLQDGDGLVSIEEATCESGVGGGKYRISATVTVEQIGCYRCDKPNQEITTAISTVKPQLTQCVLWCQDGYIIEYSRYPDEPKTRVHRLHRKLTGIFNPSDLTRPFGNWWNLEKNEELLDSIVLACVLV